MDGSSGNNGEQHVDWADPRHGVVEYHQLEASQLSGNVSAGSHFTGLQSLQGVFVTIQTSTEDNSYQSLQNDVGYQSVYMTSAGPDAYQRISPDVDYSVTADDEGLSLDSKQQFIQVPFVIGGHSQSVSGSSNQYCTVLNSYLHNLGSSVVNGTLSTAAVNDGMTLQNAVNSAVSTHSGQSSSLIHMMAPNFTPSGLSSLHTSMLVGDDGVQDDVQGLSSTFNGNCNSTYIHLSLDSSLGRNNSLQSSMSLNTGLASVIGSNGVRGDSDADVFQQLLADGDDDDDDDVGDNIQTTNELEIVHNEISNADHCEVIGCAGKHHSEREAQPSHWDMPVRGLLTRKSARLANRDNVPSPEQLAKYVSQPYNTLEIWCDDCQKSYEDECPKHKIQPLADKVVLSRAWASLPPNLQIFRLVQPASDGPVSEMGVFAKRLIPKRTQFGPFIAPSVNHPDLLNSGKFLLLVDGDNGSCEYYDAADENLCNWMMFIRPATTFSEQNLVAYQFRNEIFFSTTCNILTGQELKVWYAAHYAERLQVDLLSKPDESNDSDLADLPWSCYECSERFRTAALLQNHLNVHDDDIATHDQSPDDDDVECSRQRSSRKCANSQLQEEETSQSSMIEPSNAGVMSSSDCNEFQSWKKKKTNMYLKMKKYKEPIKRSIRMLTNKSKGGVIGICCSQCDLVFEKRELVELHSYTHLPNAKPETVQASGESEKDNSQDFACPSCPSHFKQMSLLAAHVSSHIVPRRHRPNSRSLALGIHRRPYKCLRCWKSFESEDKLRQHMMTHTDNLKPLKCDVCDKRFMNNSALSCHQKIHSSQQYYNCALCHVGFDQINMLRAHADHHKDPNTGVFSCPWCHKSFETFASARRHARAFHSLTSYPCPECGKLFPRPDKLKLHRLSHSSHREFMCETCGRQFKRKDKLREHVKRSHESTALKPSIVSAKSRCSGAGFNQFGPGSKATLSDYDKLIFKCHDCQLGFKRRGMLINHMAKRHPEVALASIPELNLPILRSQRDFYCQYCDKVYKSSSKRKAHITKSHPGAELPANAKRRSGLLGSSDVTLPNPTYSATVGSVMSEPHACEYCHKQYSTKAKLLQHLRSKHNGGTAHVYNTSNSSTIVHNVQLQGNKVILDAGNSTASKVLMITRQVNGNELQLGPHAGTSSSVATAGELTDTDILTQAMTELTQSFGTEYRVVGTMPNVSAGDYHTIVPCVVNMHGGNATLVQSLSGLESETGYATTLLQQTNVSATDPNINWNNMLTGGASFQAFNC